MKKFDFCIGNPPYQADVQNEGDRANPVYDKFMDAAFEVADCVELIHPARFLFNAGQTPKAWNQKMLSDDHLKVLFHEMDSSKIFAHTSIMGGIAITIHDKKRKYGPITVFTSHPKLNQIIEKVYNSSQSGKFLSDIVSARGMYRFSETFYSEHPEAKKLVGEGTGNMIASNAFEKLPHIFLDSPTQDEEYIRILGRKENKRIFKFIKRKYISYNEFIDKWNVFVPEANGSGAIGEVVPTPLIGDPVVGEPSCAVTDTFISIGQFDTVEMANYALKYIKSKFARTMLAVNKVTQHNPKSTWISVPMQDFTLLSDIDWSKPIYNIDQQLYRKYNLSADEIDFIESNVKEME